MKILVSALETSSNIHLKELLKEFDDTTEFFGIFDKKLGPASYDLEELAVMGFVDILKKLPFFFRLKKEMVELARKADKVLLMDSSGFNLPLAKAIKKEFPNKEIIYYILPQAWAWKKGRIPKIEKYCDKLCSILPFEKDFYSQKDKITYVGHPLLDEITSYKTQQNSSTSIVFMPGSRRTEITNHMPIFRELIKKIPQMEYVLIIPEKFDQNYIEKTYGDISSFTVSSNAHESLKKAHYAFICSGTATLEAAIIGTPFTLSYIAKKLDYFIGSRLVKLPFVGLANIFFNKMDKGQIHSEFLQENVTAQALFNDYQTMDKSLFLSNSKILRDYLQHGSSIKVKQIIQS